MITSMVNMEMSWNFKLTGFPA